MESSRPPLSVVNVVQIAEYIKSTVHSANALVGTCKMGSESDEMSVVNSALKVRLFSFRGITYFVPVDTFARHFLLSFGGEVCPCSYSIKNDGP